jgi:putative flippase GtrA
MVRLIASLYARIQHLVPELAKFGVVGGIGTVVDLGGAAVLHSTYHQGPLEAKAISVAVATIVTYAGNRYWTFRHRENQSLLREGTLFVVLNLIGLAIAELLIAFTTYVLVLKGPVSYNLASLVGTGLGTIFRYFAYRKWVFLAPAAQPAPAEPAYAAAPSLAFAPHSAHSVPLAADSGQVPPWLDHGSLWPQPVPPPTDQSPPWSDQPAAQIGQAPPWSDQPAAQIGQAPPWSDQPAAQTAQATMAPPRPRSSGGRHRKSRSA